MSASGVVGESPPPAGPMNLRPEAIGRQVLSKETQDPAQKREQETGREAFTLTQGVAIAVEYREAGQQISTVVSSLGRRYSVDWMVIQALAQGDSGMDMGPCR